VTAVPAAAEGHAFTLRGSDGVAVVATRYAPGTGPEGLGGEPPAIVIASATGVPQTLYRGIAAWLVAQGHTVYTFDWRGTAASRPPRLRGFEADFRHWVLDLDAVLAHALGQHARVSLIGHSIGGFLAPVTQNAPRLHRLVLVGAQTAHWRDWPPLQRLPMALLWHGLMPLATWICGYFPGRALRLGEDLPRGVALAWAARPWRDPFDTRQLGARADDAASLYARRLPPVSLFATSDDPFATPAATRRVAERLRDAAVSTHTLAPHEAGQRRIGHFDLFRRRAQAHWPRLRDAALA
jgi:predicted alpha/beta hydrolase